MKVNEFLIENSIQVPFPVPLVNPENAFEIAAGEEGSYYTDYLVPEAISDKRNQTVFAGIKKLCDSQNATVEYTGGSHFEVKDSDGESVLDMNFDTARTLDGELLHIVGIELAYAGKTKGLVTKIIAHVFNTLDRLHGTGYRVLEVNDDRSYGIWPRIAQKLDAYYDQL